MQYTVILATFLLNSYFVESKKLKCVVMLKLSSSVQALFFIVWPDGKARTETESERGEF